MSGWKPERDWVEVFSKPDSVAWLTNTILCGTNIILGMIKVTIKTKGQATTYACQQYNSTVT